jgi:hypothetical protein
MKIFVAGGAGFIGSNFIRRLLSLRKGYRIVNYDKRTYAGNLAHLERSDRTTPCYVGLKERRPSPAINIDGQRSPTPAKQEWGFLFVHSLSLGSEFSAAKSSSCLHPNVDSRDNCRPPSRRSAITLRCRCSLHSLRRRSAAGCPTNCLPAAEPSLSALRPDGDLHLTICPAALEPAAPVS